MSTFALIYIFFQKYVIPLTFVIGLLYFLYGVIEYFIIGAGGDEERSDHGRKLFLKSIGWFVISLALFALVALIGWLGTRTFAPPSGSFDPDPSDSSGGWFDVNREDSILQVPNVPGR